MIDGGGEMKSAGTILLAAHLLFIPFSASAIAQGSGDAALRQRLDALRKTAPGSSQERELQKEVIVLVRKMGRTPALPEEVDRHMARGESFVESGKSKGSFERAAREFREVTRLAPWLAQAHYNLGVVREKAGRFDAARESYRMYLFAAPDAPDARKVKRLIYKIEARKEEAAAQAAARAAERKKREQARLESERQRRQRKRDAELSQLKRQLEGPWCNKSFGRCSEIAAQFTVTVRGDRFEAKNSIHHRRHGYSTAWVFRGEILEGKRIKGTYTSGERLDANDSRYSSACRGRWHFHRPYNVEGEIKPGGRRVVFTFVEDYRYLWNTAECRHRVRRGNGNLRRFEFERRR